MYCSALRALSQKFGANVFSSSFVISINLASMSKIPPQRTKALYYTFNLFGICHKKFIFLLNNLVFLGLAPMVVEILLTKNVFFSWQKTTTSGSSFFV
jgi:hypothetical protein